MDTNDLKSFHYLENGDIDFSVFDTIKSTKVLDAGRYKIYIVNQNGQYVAKLCKLENLEEHEIHNFEDKEKLNNLTKVFIDAEIKAKVNKLGFKHKMGVLLYGKEGTGKSTIVNHYCRTMVTNGEALVFYMANNYAISAAWKLVQNIRKIQPNPIVIIYEEIDGLIAEYEGRLKEILDGSDSIDNCFIFSTTNYIDRVPKALKERPSRFKYSIDVSGLTCAEDIKVIIQKMIGDIISDQEAIKMAVSLVNSTLDDIKQFCLDKLMNLTHYDNDKQKIGFKTIKEETDDN